LALTVREIDNAKPKDKKYKMADGGGLELLVSPAGTKLWRWRYRFNGTPKEMALGEYPRVSIKEARDLHHAKRKLLDSGIDPMAKRKGDAEAKEKEERDRQRQEENSFEKIAKKWWDVWSTGLSSSRHAATVWKRLEDDVFPAIGHKFIDDVTPADVREVMLAIKKRGAKDVARRSHETTGQIFRHAVANGLASRNPAADFKPEDVLGARSKKHFPRVEPDELPELLVRMERYDGEALTRLAMKLMGYTFVRTAVLIGVPWTELDLDGARWNVPPERMKPHGHAARWPHIVPLSRQAVGVFRALELLTGHRKFVFPGAQGNECLSNNTILGALYSMGYRGRMTGHGFRGVASTILHENVSQELGFDHEHVELQLAHEKGDEVEAAYNYAKYLPQRTVMMQWWADYLDERLADGRKLSGRVMP
jgi:integrase